MKRWISLKSFYFIPNQRPVSGVRFLCSHSHRGFSPVVELCHLTF
jgi:hypothetical protein